jgi:hypothetical protein
MAKILKLAAVKVVTVKNNRWYLVKIMTTKYWKSLISPQELVYLRIHGFRWWPQFETEIIPVYFLFQYYLCALYFLLCSLFEYIIG